MYGSEVSISPMNCPPLTACGIGRTCGDGGCIIRQGSGGDEFVGAERWI